MFKFWYKQKFRLVAAQFVLIGSIFWLAWTIFTNMQANMSAQGITSGFGFLDDVAGFNIIMHLIPYNEASTYLAAFGVGLFNTLLVSALGVILATAIGFIIGIGRLSDNWLIKTICGAYVEIIRNIPLLLQIFFWYFAVLRALPHPRESIGAYHVFLNNRGMYLPKPVWTDSYWLFVSIVVCIILAVIIAHKIGLIIKDKTGGRPPLKSMVAMVGFVILGICLVLAPPLSGIDIPKLKGFNFQGGMVLIPELIALLAALSMYTAAFIAEIVRSGILAVSHGQREAATALGLSSSKILTLVIIPQAMKVILPPLTNQYLNLTKNSSLAAAIAYPDLVSVFAGTVLNQTGQAVEVIGITMAVYLLISLSISALMMLYEKSTQWGKA